MLSFDNICIALLASLCCLLDDGLGVAHQPAGRLATAHISNEHYACADEGDVQGQFNSNISQLQQSLNLKK